MLIRQGKPARLPRGRRRGGPPSGRGVVDQLDLLRRARPWPGGCPRTASRGRRSDRLPDRRRARARARLAGSKLPSSRSPVVAAPSGRMSCSQRTSGSFLSPELAIAGSRAGKLGEATSIRSGRGRSGRPRKGLAAVRAAVKLRLLPQPRALGSAPGHQRHSRDADPIDGLLRGQTTPAPARLRIVGLGRNHVDAPTPVAEQPREGRAHRGYAGRLGMEVDGPELKAAPQSAPPVELESTASRPVLELLSARLPHRRASVHMVALPPSAANGGNRSQRRTGLDPRRGSGLASLPGLRRDP